MGRKSPTSGSSLLAKVPVSALGVPGIYITKKPTSLFILTLLVPPFLSPPISFVTLVGGLLGLLVISLGAILK